MNKKILMSLVTILAVVGASLGATAAYFSDTETSIGNVFAAGSIDLKVDNECYLQGEQITDCTWLDLRDLSDEVFFHFADLKPGAYGEDTVSLHVYENDAWAWLKIDSITSNENICTEPEQEEDGTCGDPGEGEGELLENLDFLIWLDDGDNKYEEGEEILHESNFEPYLPGRCKVWQLDGNSSTSEVEPLEGSQDYYLGFSWCFGIFDNNYQCDGASIGNNVQTDSLTMNISFTAVQAQNNPEAKGGPVCN